MTHDNPTMAGSTELIIAEKPSVGRDIAAVLGVRTRRDGYLEGRGIRVSWCVGHLAELCEPHEYNPEWKSWSPALLPIVPERFRVRPARGSIDQLRVLEALLGDPDVGTVINACDAGREGELIFRFVYELARCTKPVRRLWISSLTPEAIRAGMARLRPAAELDPLADAARCRAEADWLVGMNATRALTGLARRAGGDALMSVGRVQTPTLALIVRREEAIEAFVSEPFWEVKATFAAAQPPAGYHYQGLWHRRPVAEALGAGDRPPPSQDAARPVTPAAAAGPARSPQGSADQATDAGRDAAESRTRLATRAEAEAIAEAVRGRPGQVSGLVRKAMREPPPLLYDLTDLQKTANRRFGMSAQQTLAAAQSLYETRKAVTYPRTDSRHLTSDLAAGLPDLLAALEPCYGELARQAHARCTAPGVPGRRMINDSEVGDHHAIIPTGIAVDVDRLSADERRIFDLVARRFLAGFLADAVFEKTRIETMVGEHLFVSEGRVCVDPGWQAAEPPPPRQGAEPALPALRQGTPVDTTAVALHEGKTQPPRRYTEATLLGAMERADKMVEEAALRRALRDKGLGTPATRAAIIENLLRRRYVLRQGRELHPTAQGRALVTAMPVEDLLSAELTGAWEAKLARVARGELERPHFMAEIRAFVGQMVDTIARADGATMTGVGPEPLGSCPLCGTPVSAGFKAYQCARKGTCTFAIYKRIAGRKTSPSLVQVLLARGRTQVLKGFRSKQGKRFSAALVLSPEGRVELAFERDAASSTAPRSPRPSTGSAHAPGKSARSAAASSSRRRPAAAKAIVQDRAAAKAIVQDKAASPATPAGPRCPACRKGHIIAGNRGWGCSRWREACRFVVSFEQQGVRIPADEGERLFRRGRTRLMPGFSPEGPARLVLDLGHDGNVRTELGKRSRTTQK